jgi:transposase
MLSLVAPEQRVPQAHPLRRIKQLADTALQALSPTFDEMYSAGGRPSVPPERLLKSTLLMAFYTVRSDRLFCEQLEYNLLFRWFLDMDMVEESFDHSTFSKNRQRPPQLRGQRADGEPERAHRRSPDRHGERVRGTPRRAGTPG